MDGVSALSDSLMALGWVVPSETMMFKSLLGIYANEQSPDSYSSTIDFHGEDPPTVNGQPLPF
jgi:hypothetical protein